MSGSGSPPEPPTDRPPRAFSIAFAWGGLIVGGFAWILAWGARHMPERGEEFTHEMLEIDTVDIVLLAALPLGIAALAGRLGRRVFP